MSNDIKRKSTRLVLLAAAALDVAVLVRLQPNPRLLGRELAAPHAWLAAAGPDAALATLAGAALWAVAVWFAVGLLAVSASRLPGRIGRLAAGVARVALPRAVTRLCAGALGASVLLTPAAALAHPGPGGTDARPVGVAASTAASTAARSPAVPAPGWPTSPPTPAPPVPTPSWPQQPAPQQPAPQRPAPHPPAPPTPPTPSAGPATTGTVEVRPGDSLWLIAARRLGPGASPEQISLAWQRWYAANRTVIGPDPGLIRPGAVLSAPPEPTRP